MAEYVIKFADCELDDDSGRTGCELIIDGDVEALVGQAAMYTMVVIEMFNNGELDARALVKFKELTGSTDEEEQT